MTIVQFTRPDGQPVMFQQEQIACVLTSTPRPYGDEQPVTVIRTPDGRGIKVRETYAEVVTTLGGTPREPVREPELRQVGGNDGAAEGDLGPDAEDV
jgi:hypothetical protein